MLGRSQGVVCRGWWSARMPGAAAATPGTPPQPPTPTATRKGSPAPARGLTAAKRRWRDLHSLGAGKTLQTLKARASTFVTWHNVISKRLSALLMEALHRSEITEDLASIYSMLPLKKHYFLFSLQIYHSLHGTKFSVNSRCTRSCFPTSCDPCFLQRASEQPQWRTNICTLSSSVSHLLLKISHCKVGPKGRNADLPFQSENIFVIWKVRTATCHKYTKWSSIRTGILAKITDTFCNIYKLHYSLLPAAHF